jgi:hypothetical protein
MSTVHARRKAMRGTKRTCQACEVRFYDLGRSVIVCPMCGANYTPPAEPAVRATARAAPFAGKTGWHRQPLKRALPAPPVAEAMPSDRFAAAAADEEIEEAATVESEDGASWSCRRYGCRRRVDPTPTATA